MPLAQYNDVSLRIWAFIFALVVAALPGPTVRGADSLSASANCEAALDHRRVSRLWRNDDLRQKTIDFLTKGLLADAPKLRRELIEELNAVALVAAPLDDLAIYTRLRAIVERNKPEFKKAFESDDRARILNRLSQVAELLEGKKPSNYLDIGAGDGLLSRALKESFGLSKESSYAVDVADYRKSDDLSWLAYNADGSIPLKSDSIELASLFMVLHHIGNPAQVIAEAHRVLRPGGTLLVRETNAWTKDIHLLNSVLDTMFYEVFFPRLDVPLPTSYRARHEWESAFRDAGFIVKKISENEPGNPFAPVNFVLEKPVNREELVFESPQKYRDLIRERINIPLPDALTKNAEFYVFPTKFCPVGCGHCYFASPRQGSKPLSSPFVLSDKALTNFTDLVARGGARQLTITGGGDPMLEPARVAYITRNSRAERFSMHTSGFWATNAKRTRELIDQVYRAFTQNGASGFRFRISIDQHHKKVPPKNLLNIVDTFSSNASTYKARGFGLAFHSIYGDPVIQNFAASLKSAGVAERVEYSKASHPDHPTKIVIKGGLEIEVDYSPLMPANPAPEMNDALKIEESVAQFDAGRAPYPALSANRSGEEKACMCVYENGTVELWNSGAPDNLANIYRHTPEEVLRSFGDVIYNASVEKGAIYVESLINEVDPWSVKRAKAIASATLFNKNALAESKTRLYVSIRIIQDKIAEGTLASGVAEKLPSELRKLIASSRGDLQAFYRRSRQTIVEDTLAEPGVEVERLVDLYDAIKKGHYRGVTVERMKESVAADTRISPRAKKLFFLRIYSR